jgi:hypothetical protein
MFRLKSKPSSGVIVYNNIKHKLLSIFEVEVEVEVNLRPTISRPVCLGVRLSSGAHDQIFVFCLTIVGFLMWGALSDERIYCYNGFWALPEQSLWGANPAGLRPYCTVSFVTPPTWRARFQYLFPSRTGWPSYTPGHCVPYSSPLTTRRATVEVL